MKSVLLIGLGRFGRHMAQKLRDLGHEVLAVDKDEERINAALSYVTNAQIGDSTNAHSSAPLGYGTSISVWWPLATASRALWRPPLCSRSTAPLRAVQSHPGRPRQIPPAQRRGRDRLPGKADGQLGGGAVQQRPYFDYIELTQDYSILRPPFPAAGWARPWWSYLSGRPTASIFWPPATADSWSSPGRPPVPARRDHLHFGRKQGCTKIPQKLRKDNGRGPDSIMSAAPSPILSSHKPLPGGLLFLLSGTSPPCHRR